VDAEKMTMADQLTSDELRQVLAEWIRPMYTRERRKIAGLFEAVIARAEAAEADNRRLTARVAELEAQLAAQGWQPVTEEPDADAMYPVRVQYRGQVYLDREMRNWNRASGWNDMFAQSKVVEWYPLPPAPQETE
jgi:hypothetical protein